MKSHSRLTNKMVTFTYGTTIIIWRLEGWVNLRNFYWDQLHY